MSNSTDSSRPEAIRVVCELTMCPGLGDEFIERWRPHELACRKQWGCLQYEVYRNPTNPDQFVLLELWESREAYDEHWEAELSNGVQIDDLRADARVEFHDGRIIYELRDGTWRPA